MGGGGGASVGTSVKLRELNTLQEVPYTLEERLLSRRAVVLVHFPQTGSTTERKSKENQRGNLE